MRKEEGFDQSTPTVIPQKIRADNSCPNSQESAYFDRFDNAGMNLMKASALLPLSYRNNTLSGTRGSGYGPLESSDTNLTQTCKGDSSGDGAGNKVFIDTGILATNPNNGVPLVDSQGNNFNSVDIYCCKGNMVQVPGTNSSNCLPPCPDGYIPSTYDPSICVRIDGNCIYNADLSANLTQNWLNTCGMIYKNSINLNSTINSIKDVVSSFSTQTGMASNDFYSLSYKLYNTTLSASDPKRSYITSDFNGDLTPKFNTLYSLQTDINSRLTQLQSDKAKFDTMFNQFSCSNYMY